MPGDGICFRMKPGNSEGIGGLLYEPNGADNLHDVIIRYLMFRQGWTLTYKGHGARSYNIYSRRGYKNVLGEFVKTLISTELNSGSFTVNFNAANLSSGIYIYTLKGSGVNFSKK